MLWKMNCGVVKVCKFLSGVDDILAEKLLQRLVKVFNRFGLAKAMTFTWINMVNMRHITLFQRCNHLVGLFSRDHLVIFTLENCHGILNFIDKENWRALVIQ